MFGNNDGCTQFHVDFPDGIQKVGSSNGVQLTGRLVQNQDFRLHRHDRSQIQQLLLTPGEIGYISVKPILNSKIASHFRNTGTHRLLVTAKAFQAEGQFMPYLICNDLVVGILHHIADFGRLIPLADLLKGRSVKQNLALFLAVRRKNGFQLPQKGCLTTAGFAAKNNIFSPFNGKAHTVQGLFTLGGRIRKT